MLVSAFRLLEWAWFPNLPDRGFFHPPNYILIDASTTNIRVVSAHTRQANPTLLHCLLLMAHVDSLEHLVDYVQRPPQAPRLYLLHSGNSTAVFFSPTSSLPISLRLPLTTLHRLYILHYTQSRLPSCPLFSAFLQTFPHQLHRSQSSYRQREIKIHPYLLAILCLGSFNTSGHSIFSGCLLPGKSEKQGRALV